jgi:hypothetical protein
MVAAANRFLSKLFLLSKLYETICRTQRCSKSSRGLQKCFGSIAISSARFPNKKLPLSKIALLFVRLDHVASRIVTGINGLKKRGLGRFVCNFGIRFPVSNSNEFRC